MPSSVDHLAAYRTDGYRRRDGSEGPVYQVPDVVYRSPSIRKIRVICIGAGISGIMNSYNIQKHTENVEHVVYEKNADIGGTWLVNRYPGQRAQLLPLNIISGFNGRVTQGVVATFLVMLIPILSP